MKVKYLMAVILSVLMIGVSVSTVSAHCQIPCGIYNDQLRIEMIREDATTIEKSMNEIVKLSKESPVNYNQLVRWVTNKDDHATKIQDIVSQYFLSQRIKPDQEKYHEKLALLHQIIVAAMKCKQTTDLSNVENLRELTTQFTRLYFSKEDLEHLKEHDDH